MTRFHFVFQSNLTVESKLTELQKPPPRTHKPSISSFKFPFDSIKSDLTSTLKKSRDKFKDSKKVKDAKSVGGHSHIMTPPQSLNFSDSVNIDMGDSSSPAVAEKTIVDEIKESTPKCWRTLYHLLELYSTMPETKTVSHRPDRAQLPVIEEEAEKQTTGTPSDSIKTRLDLAAEEEAEIGGGSSGKYENTPLARSTFSRTRFKQSEYYENSKESDICKYWKISCSHNLVETKWLCTVYQDLYVLPRSDVQNLRYNTVARPQQ